MSDTPNARALRCKDGELLLVRVSIDPKLLEDLLESLARLDFPVNPQIYHAKPTIVEFPAYSEWMDNLQRRLEYDGFPRSNVAANSMLDVIAVN